MKWKILWNSEMDTNDADYVKDSGVYGIVDDENAEEVKELALTEQAVTFCALNFDDGGVQIDEEELAALMKDKSHDYNFIKEIGITDEEIDAFLKNVNIWDLMYEYEPRDPNDDSNAHDLDVNFKRVPADYKEEDLDTSWYKKAIMKGKGPIQAG